MSSMGVVGPIDATRDDRRLNAARRRYSEYPAGDLEYVGRDLIADKASGIMFHVIRNEILESLYPEATEGVAGFFVDADAPVFLRRAEGTLDEWRQQQAADQQQQEQTREREQAKHAAFLDRQPRVAVTLSDLEGEPLPTIRAAARLVVDLGGEIKARDGRLVITAPERLAESPILDRGMRQDLYRAARVVYAAADRVLAEIDRGGRRGLDLARLPDEQALP